MSETSEGQGRSDPRMLVKEYMYRASEALAGGDSMLGLHLLLAAYGQAAEEGGELSQDGLTALKGAWDIAIQLKERSLAEYIFEKLEPLLSSAEMESYTQRLEDLAFDKLEEYGISRKDLEEVTNTVAREMENAPDNLGFGTTGAAAVAMAPGILGRGGDFSFPLALGSIKRMASAQSHTAASGATDAKTNASEPERDGNADSIGLKTADPGNDARGGRGDKQDTSLSVAGASSRMAAQKTNDMQADVDLPHIDLYSDLRYADLAGYANAIRDARTLGIGRAKDPAYIKLIQTLNAAHGMIEPPAFDPVMITAPVREDATRFASATVGELGLPLFRMYVEDNPQGLQALCVYAQNNPRFKFDRRTGAFEGKGIVLLEDIDLWELPPTGSELEDSVAPFVLAQMNRSLREVYNFIRSAVENPDVYVLVTAQADTPIDPFFSELLEPCQHVDIQMPTPGERASIWMQIMAEHPSLYGASVAALVKNSANMSRYEIYEAVSSVLDDAYREDLRRGKATHVKPVKLYERLAAYQTLDSPEYKTLEDAVVRDFRTELSHIDDLLK